MYNNFEIHDIEEINGLKEIKFDTFEDERGLLYTNFLLVEFKKYFPNLEFVHDKFALNNRTGTLRGMHGDDKSWKLVSIVSGSAHQVIIDPRVDSKTFGNTYEKKLTGSNPAAILIPPGCGNGFQTLEENTLYHYKLAYSGEYNDADSQFTIPWNTSEFIINWPINKPTLSNRDKNARD